MTSALTLQGKTNGQYHAFAAPSALKTEFKVKSSPWHDKLKADMTSALTLQGKTNGQYHAFAAPYAPY